MSLCEGCYWPCYRCFPVAIPWEPDTMSYGLMVATEIEHIPQILRTVATNYRGTETRRYPHLWLYAAELIEEAANMMADRIKLAKETEPEFRIKRSRL